MTEGPRVAAPTTGRRLEVTAGSGRWSLAPGREVVIGRGSDADVQVLGDEVSRRHAVLRHTAGGWLLEDCSSNGTFADGTRVERLLVNTRRRISLGAHGPEVELVPADLPTAVPATPRPAVPAPRTSSFVAPGSPSAVHPMAARGVTIGRAASNDIVLPDLLVSRRHASLVRSGAGWEIVDLGSDNGTYVNGRRVTRSPVEPDDAIGIGHQVFRLVEGRLEEYLETGGVAFQADGLVVTAGGRRLLDGVSFALDAGMLLGVIGPSGAGKSTLLNALTGFRPADGGSVGYAGRDLYSNYDDLRNRMGLVPQQDVLHAQLTVRRALTYAARLRFPRDVSETDRARRIEEVLDELGLTAHAEQRISTLSGGQRKRASIALELLVKPSLLFLDEPTSGLDPGLDRSVTNTLRDLAHGGRTVVCVTHNVTNLHLYDRLLVLAPGGRTAYFGPPAEAAAYFGVDNLADVFLHLESDPGADWTGRYRSSPLAARYLRSALVPVAAGAGDMTQAEEAPRQQSTLAQFATLSRRYLHVIASDRQYVGFLAALPLVLALLVHAVPSANGLMPAGGGAGGYDQRAQVLLVLVLGGCLMGTGAALRELVKEREIYRRERAIGLSIVAYLGSKLVVLALVTGVQAVVLAVLALAGRRRPDSPVLLPGASLEILVAIVAVALVSMTIGLLISALVENADRTMPLLVLVIMAQLVLSGGFVPVAGRVLLGPLSWLAPARWAYAATASTVELLPLPASEGADALWGHSAHVWVSDLLALAVIAAVLTVLVAYALRRLDPRRRADR